MCMSVGPGTRPLNFTLGEHCNIAIETSETTVFLPLDCVSGPQSISWGFPSTGRSLLESGFLVTLLSVVAYNHRVAARIISSHFWKENVSS